MRRSLIYRSLFIEWNGKWNRGTTSVSLILRTPFVEYLLMNGMGKGNRGHPRSPSETYFMDNLLINEIEMGIGVTTPGKKLYYKAHLKWITKYLKKREVNY